MSELGTEDWCVGWKHADAAADGAGPVGNIKLPRDSEATDTNAVTLAATASAAAEAVMTRRRVDA